MQKFTVNIQKNSFKKMMLKHAKSLHTIMWLKLAEIAHIQTYRETE